ncbi:DUF7742 family protein [Mameliella alba]|uniref:DUF7742 family protein n=1 Tax=Mameliella alba TaxID=561184 RepID=UPI003F5D3585
MRGPGFRTVWRRPICGTAGDGVKPVLPGDVIAAARALLPVPPDMRSELARRLIDEACAADLHCQRTGRAHVRWGNGTLSAAAHGCEMGRETCFEDPDFLDCQVKMLDALRAFYQPEAQEIQRIAVGSSSRRLMAISSPQSSQ